MRIASVPIQRIETGSLCTLKNALIATTVVVSIIGIAASILMSAFAAAAGFAALGAVSLITIKVSHGGGVDLESANEKLRATKDKMEKATEELRSENLKLKGNKEELKATVDKLGIVNKQLEKENNKWKENNEKLALSNAAFHENNESLKQRTKELKVAHQQLKDQVNTFIKHNVELGKNLGIFKTEVNVLDKETDEFSDKLKHFDSIMDENLREYAKQIEVGKETAKKSIEAFQKEKDAIQLQNENLEKTIQRIQAQQILQNQEIAKLTDLQTATLQVTNNLQTVKGELAKTESSYESTLATLKEEEKKLDAIRAQYADENIKLEKVRTELNTLLPQYAELEHKFNAITEKFEKKLTQLQELKAKK